MDRRLSGVHSGNHSRAIHSNCNSNNHGCSTSFLQNIDQHSPASSSCHHHKDTQTYKFQTITICHANAVFTFAQIHSNPKTKIRRILSHQETGHYKSYSRDKALRKWCKRNNVQWIEFNQTGVTRCLKDRDDFAKKLNLFLMKPLYSSYEKQDDYNDVNDEEEQSKNDGGNNLCINNNNEEKIQQSCITNLIPNNAQTSNMKSLSSSSSTTTTTIAASGASKSATSILQSIQNEYHANYTTIHTSQIIQTCQKHATTNFPNLHNRIYHPIQLSDLTELPPQHRIDRIQRQQIGGESHALEMLHSFLNSRGSNYSSDISSPNTSWTSCSRLSPYLTWGHISTRFVMHETRKRQEYFRNEKKKNGKKKKTKDSSTTNADKDGTSLTCTSTSQSKPDGYWLKSLQAFSSRMHWRSHFIQKLETEPEMEKRDLCPAYSHLRRQPNDWNQSYYDAWSTGRTGFPFVDACMRCLIQHGWLNFRMRCMLVSFASYNLWLDWKKTAPHLARLFLDYEPGIHYPQLQMQSGTTGINAMRVYNVTKQSKDQDPKGVFIKKYVPELKNVPLDYIHEPSKMPMKLQCKLKVFIGSKEDIDEYDQDGDERYELHDQDTRCFYPKPIVNESESAKSAKDKIAAVRKLNSTKELAEQVYQKHGSRNNREREMGKKSKSPTKESDSTQPTKKAKSSQRSIIDLFAAVAGGKSDNSTSRHEEQDKKQGSWNCSACTFLNLKPLALTCSICGTIRKQTKH